MSDSIKCFDVVSMVVDEASKQFGSIIWELNKEKYDVLKNYCEAIDKLSDSFDGVSFEAEVDEINMTIKITLECAEAIVDSPNHIYYKLLERSKSFGISVTDNNTINLSFVFPSLWDKRC